jgi:hypothetical protein
MMKTDRLAERRAFLKKAGVAAATVPAAALLLSAQAKAQTAPDPYSTPNDAVNVPR